MIPKYYKQNRKKKKPTQKKINETLSSF